ncbi:MAG: hypothetical protein J6C19_04945 [Lachnospiraceae bacterium]|nr:hypothetical protein [Lachnospiraceae bacterium]
MKRLETVTKIVLISILLCTFMLLADILALSYLALKTDDGLSQPPVSYIANQLQKTADDSGAIQYSLSQEGKDRVNEYSGFVFLMDDKGDVIWSYRLLDDIPMHFTVKQIVQFTRFYLNDYPVFTQIIDDGIVVVGTPKNSTWKYNLVFQIKTMEMFRDTLPLMIVTNIVILLIVPLLLVRHDSRRREMERTTWIAGVSHDIRTPLSLVLGYADEIVHTVSAAKLDRACESRSESSPDMGGSAAFNAIADKAQIIEEQAVRIRTLVTNLNMENKLTYGMGSWRKEPLLLPAVIRNTVCEVLNRTPEDKYDISVSIPESLEQLVIRGNEELVKRMLENLMNNAVNHNPQGCEISIRLTQRRLLLFAKCSLEISDNGCGVSRKQLKSFRASVKSDKLPEHGLGIRLVRQIASFHRWSVRFYNNENGGFCCRVGICHRWKQSNFY